MAAKSNKEKTSAKKNIKQPASTDKSSAKTEKQFEDDNDPIDDETDTKINKKPAASKSINDDLEEGEADADVEVEDDWNKPEEDEDWDPDFDEFDLPKSSAKKALTGKKAPKDDDDNFKVDDEFKDMFNDPSSKYDEEDDDY